VIKITKRKINVKKHPRKLPTGKVTLVKKHNREIEKVKISKFDKEKFKLRESLRLDSGDTFKETTFKSPKVKQDSGYTVHYRYSVRNIQDAKWGVKEWRSNGYAAYYYRGSQNKKVVYRIYSTNAPDLRYKVGDVPKKTVKTSKKSIGYKKWWDEMSSQERLEALGDLGIEPYEKGLGSEKGKWFYVEFEPGEYGAVTDYSWDELRKSHSEIAGNIRKEKKLLGEKELKTEPKKLMGKSVEELALQGYNRLLRDPDLNTKERRLYEQKVKDLTEVIEKETKKPKAKPKSKEKSQEEFEKLRLKLIKVEKNIEKIELRQKQIDDMGSFDIKLKQTKINQERMIEVVKEKEDIMAKMKKIYEEESKPKAKTKLKSKDKKKKEIQYISDKEFKYTSSSDLEEFLNENLKKEQRLNSKISISMGCRESTKEP